MHFENYPALNRLVSRQLGLWPEHTAFLRSSFAGRTEVVMGISETLAQAVLVLSDAQSDGLDTLCKDYRYLCEEIVLPEEIFFRRNGHYRLTRFEDANAECYANAPFMARYMNGLLISNVFWSNHAQAFASFATEYLDRLPLSARHLEIGPGHGLFLYFAAKHPSVAAITGWDISPTSIDKTRHALELLQARIQPQLLLQDMFKANLLPEHERFDSVAMSEILEHLEDPVAALRAAMLALKPGGQLFINVPANSPAPDHIFLFESPEHAAQIVSQAGLQVVQVQAFPMSGTTLARAQKHKLAVSCVLVAHKPA
jgi:2-polyprenyl-3-methyl-5-hydroxy-6-metoxy-1,4-benzoquinol methylase